MALLGKRSVNQAGAGAGVRLPLSCFVDGPSRVGKNKKIEDDYILGPQLGHGHFGSVRICQSRVNGQEFACKTLQHLGKEKEKEKDHQHQEVQIMQHLRGHPGIVNLNAVYEDSECFHLVMELCSGGSLNDQMIRKGRYSELQAAKIIKELMLIIRYCHGMGVVHCDIKPHNILLMDSGKIKLADFGLALRISNDESICGMAGSPAYLAPEVLEGPYSHKVDIWSVGVILHSLLIGVLPFQEDSVEAMLEALKKKKKLDFDTGIWTSISAPARDLIKRMLTWDVSSRITAGEVLTHPWILFHTRRRVMRKSAVRSKVGGPSTNDASEEKVVPTSHMQIPEAKRSRLNVPTSLIQQNYFTKANNLCPAF